MVTPPPTGYPDPFVVTPFQDHSATGSNEGGSGGHTFSLAWPNANQAIFAPITIGGTRTYKTCFWYNGATSSGNMDFGIYDTTGAKIGSSIGSTAQGAINTFQQVTFPTPITLTPGKYFLALAMDNAVGTIIGCTPVQMHLRCGGWRNLGTFFPLGASASAWVGFNNGLGGRMFAGGICELSTL